MTAAYEALKEKIPEIIKLTEKAPEQIRVVLCQALLDGLGSGLRPAAAGGRPSVSTAPPSERIATVSTDSAGQRELPGIAVVDEGGNIRLTVRALGGKSNLENARRLVYITIRAWESLTGEDGIQREQMNNILKTWRLYDGNTRSMIAKDKGVQRDGGILRLDTPGKHEADEFIQQVLEPPTG